MKKGRGGTQVECRHALRENVKSDAKSARRELPSHATVSPECGEKVECDGRRAPRTEGECVKSRAGV